MSLKVLHISSGNLYGGVETLLATLARERDACQEMEPHFALCFEGRLSSELSAVSIPATILGPVRTRAPWRCVADASLALKAGEKRVVNNLRIRKYV